MSCPASAATKKVSIRTVKIMHRQFFLQHRSLRKCAIKNRLVFRLDYHVKRVVLQGAVNDRAQEIASHLVQPPNQMMPPPNQSCKKSIADAWWKQLKGKKRPPLRQFDWVNSIFSPPVKLVLNLSSPNNFNFQH